MGNHFAALSYYHRVGVGNNFATLELLLVVVNTTGWGQRTILQLDGVPCWSALELMLLVVVIVVVNITGWGWGTILQLDSVPL